MLGINSILYHNRCYMNSGRLLYNITNTDAFWVLIIIIIAEILSTKSDTTFASIPLQYSKLLGIARSAIACCINTSQTIRWTTYGYKQKNTCTLWCLNLIILQFAQTVSPTIICINNSISCIITDSTLIYFFVITILTWKMTS